MACVWSLDNTQVPVLAPMHGATRATENLENCFNFQQTIYLPVTFPKAFFFLLEVQIQFQVDTCHRIF